MTGTGSLRVQGIRTALALAVVVPLVAACISNRVTVDASDSDVLAQAVTLHVALAREPAAEAGSGTDGNAAAAALPPAPPPARGPAIDPVIESALLAHAENTLRAKGYAIGSAAESDLILELTPRQESVSRRTWSSDPDASGARIVQKSEAVLSLRARPDGESAEIWAGEARARLPESELVFGTSTEEVWIQVLAKALERVPERSDPIHR